MSRDPNWMDPEQPITEIVLSDILTRMQLKEEIDPRLYWRALHWSFHRINFLGDQIARARLVLNEQQ